MKNMKVSKKLIISFLIVAILAGATGVVGITGMLEISATTKDMYYQKLYPLPYLGRSMETLQRMRVNVRDMVKASMDDDMDGVEKYFGNITRLIPVMAGHLDSYRAGIVNEEAIRTFEEARRLYEAELTPVVLAINAAAKVQDFTAIRGLLIQCIDLSDRILDGFDDCMRIASADAQKAYQESVALANSQMIVNITIMAIALASAIFFAFYISSLISKPLKTLSSFMRKVGSTGDLTITPDESAALDNFGKIRDEIGETVKYTSMFFEQVLQTSDELEVIAGGDLSHEVTLVSEKDTMGLSLKNVVDNLNTMFGEINVASGQVTSGSKQIAEGAQSLAQGSTEQAATVQELSSSMTEISSKTKTNAEMAGRAASLANTIKGNAEKGSGQMDEMMSAVKDINAASQSISKVIKVIDDIAFQTNILALNAAVEAARAGQHGKGFAVVAEEVRNLAAKSAEAAKDTGGLIANSIEKAELGARIADNTAASLVEIVSGINESTQIVNEIARSSEEQSMSIAQINTGIDQVSQVVQQNSATAQESAAASQVMNGQSATLENLIAQFKLKGGGNKIRGISSGMSKPAPVQQYREPDDVYDPGDTGSFGKY